MHQSGDVSYTGHITKAGNPVLRSIFIQCARVGIKSDKRLKEFYLRIKQSTKGEKKAIIALARKIVVYAYWILKKNVTYKDPWPKLGGPWV